MDVHYECLVVKRTPNPGGAHKLPGLEIVDKINPLKKIAWSDELVGDNMGTVALESTNIPESVGARFVDMARYPCELWIYREGVLVHGGPILGLQTQGDTINVISRGPLYYLNYMFIQSDYKATKDQYTIFKDLINQWQDDSYGHFGLNVLNIGTSGTNRAVDYAGNELRSVRRELELLAANADGFDFYIDYSTARLLSIGAGGGRRDIVLENRSTGGRGDDKSSSVVFDVRNLRDVRIWASVAEKDIASWCKVLGTSEQGSWARTATNTELMQTFGKAGAVQHIDGIQSANTVQPYADDMRDLLNDYHIEIGGQQQGASIFSTSNVSAVDFGAGDKVRFLWDAGYGVIDEAREVYRKFVSIDETGTEKMTVEFT